MFHERIELSKEVNTKFISSNDQLANIFIKSLRGPRIQYICSKVEVWTNMLQLEECWK